MPVVVKGIASRPAVRQLIRVSHADQINGNAPSKVGQSRHDVAPQIGTGRIAVLEDQRAAFLGAGGCRLINHRHAEPINRDRGVGLGLSANGLRTW